MFRLEPIELANTTSESSGSSDAFQDTSLTKMKIRLFTDNGVIEKDVRDLKWQPSLDECGFFERRQNKEPNKIRLKKLHLKRRRLNKESKDIRNSILTIKKMMELLDELDLTPDTQEQRDIICKIRNLI